MNAIAANTFRLLLGLICLGTANGLVSCRNPETNVMNTPLTAVWIQPSWPSQTMPAPPGFAVTPWQAYQAVAQARALSLKHAWFCYRDHQSYYIADAFGRAIDAGNARRHGVRVDGHSGKVMETPRKHGRL